MFKMFFLCYFFFASFKGEFRCRGLVDEVYCFSVPTCIYYRYIYIFNYIYIYITYIYIYYNIYIYVYVYIYT